MAYSTIVQVRDALAPGNFTDETVPYEGNPTGTAADLSNEQLQDAITEADSTINSYIGGRYVVPVVNAADGTPLPNSPFNTPPLTYWSRNIAAYNATLTFRRSQDFTDDDPVARRYRATMIELTGVRDGKAVIPGIQVDQTPTATGGAGTVINRYPGSDMFQPSDFDLYLTPDINRGHSWWRW